MKTVAISGGFDPLHGGHVDLIEEAAEYGQVVVILNSDMWLAQKKGYCFMDWEHRRKILLALREVHNVISVDDRDGTVCEALLHLQPDYFANGGDRNGGNIPELGTCGTLGIKLLDNIGGPKTASSSDLIRAVK